MLTLRLFYREHLSQFRTFRAFRDALFVIIYWLGLARWAFLRRFVANTYRLTALSQFSPQAITPIIVDPPHQVTIPGPRFFGRKPPDHVDHSVVVHTPVLEIRAIANATLMGGTNFVFVGNTVIHPDYYNAKREVCPAETFRRISIQPDMRHVGAYLKRRRRRIERAASLLGQCAGNYAHWFTEVLPKLLVLDSVPEFKELPLLVDGWVHPNFHEALQLINKNKRELIFVNRWEPIDTGFVVCLSPPGYIPAEYRDYVQTGKISQLTADEFPFSRSALVQLRSALLDAVARSPGGRPSRKLYIRRGRSGNAREDLNAEEAESIAQQLGFAVIEPGAMSFTEQVATFSEADVVAGQIGAALTNLLFAPTGCKVVATAPYYQNANYYFWANFLGLLGHELCHVIGPQGTGSGHLFHRSYSVDMADFRGALEAACHSSEGAAGPSPFRDAQVGTS